MIKLFKKKKESKEKEKIVESGFVYFIYSKDEILYVGKTNNILNRLRTHGVLHRKWIRNIDFVYKFRDDIIDRIEFIECKDNLSLMEKKFIGFFKPKHNIQYKNESHNIDLKEYEFKNFDLDKNHTTIYEPHMELIIQDGDEYMMYYNKVILKDGYEWCRYNMSLRYNLLDSLLDLIENKELWKRKQKDVMLSLNVLNKYGLIEINHTSPNALTVTVVQHINYIDNKLFIQRVMENQNKDNNSPPFVSKEEEILSIDMLKTMDILVHKVFGEGIVVGIQNNVCLINFKKVGVVKILIGELSKPVLKFRKFKLGVNN